MNLNSLFVITLSYPDTILIFLWKYATKATVARLNIQQAIPAKIKYILYSFKPEIRFEMYLKSSELVDVSKILKIKEKVRKIRLPFKYFLWLCFYGINPTVPRSKKIHPSNIKKPTNDRMKNHVKKSPHIPKKPKKMPLLRRRKRVTKNKLISKASLRISFNEYALWGICNFLPQYERENSWDDYETQSLLDITKFLLDNIDRECWADLIEELSVCWKAHTV